MLIQHLNIHSFRNLHQVDLSFSDNTNFIFGDNAQGKTNIAEAIYILCLAKSFRAREETEMVPFEEDHYNFDGTFTDENAISSKIQVWYSKDLGKKIKVDGKPVTRYSLLIGKFPIVALTSDDHVVTTGAPAQRRKFFNILLSQCSPRYLDDLKKYERIVKQRNQVLTLFQTGKSVSKSQLEIWNDQLVQTGLKVMEARKKMTRDMNSNLFQFYQDLTRSNHDLKVIYQPCVPLTENSDNSSAFYNMLLKSFDRERRRGTTLAGPHRDEFVISVNENELRRYGSRGEHKSALVSLKAAESVLLKEKTGTLPILLLDDLYSELDINRGKSVLSLFSGKSQTFVTGTSMDYEAIKSLGAIQKDQSVFMVSNGSVTRTQ